MLEKAKTLTADALVPDMEDSVPVEEKPRAREVVAGALPGLAAAGRKLIPRTNSLGTGLLEEDLAAVVGPYIFGVTVGKIASQWDVGQVSSLIGVLEERAGIPIGSIRLVPWVETAGGVVRAAELCAASSRIVAVAFGAEDLTADMGVPRSEEGTEVAYARSAVAVAARAAGIVALDTPYVNFRNIEGLRRDVTTARQLGFKGKFAIHPSQIETINTLFSPTKEEIEYARRVVQAYAEVEAQGRGATSLDGKMIDAPIVRRARDLLALAAAMGKTGE